MLPLESTASIYDCLLDGWLPGWLFEWMDSWMVGSLDGSCRCRHQKANNGKYKYKKLKKILWFRYEKVKSEVKICWNLLKLNFPTLKQCVKLANWCQIVQYLHNGNWKSTKGLTGWLTDWVSMHVNSPSKSPLIGSWHACL